MLQPVAHMVLQMRDEVQVAMQDLPWSLWNVRPAGVASLAFHVRHIAGVLDRLFTYARGEALSAEQFDALRMEPRDVENAEECAALLAHLRTQVDVCLAALRTTDPATLADVRYIGRARLPSTVIGCLVHGAEHGMRHLGQLLVTARVIRDQAALAR